MNTSEKQALTLINKDKTFQKVVKKLTTNETLENSDQIFILACAILFLKAYDKDKRSTSYADLAYYLILKYSLNQQDYAPLYDFTINFGFYPISKVILERGLNQHNLINTCLADYNLDKFRNRNNYYETLEQFKESKNFLNDDAKEKCYLAPTSFGKSSLIAEYIRTLDKKSKVAIILPTKSLLMQTYQMLRNSQLDKKIIIHDEMYKNEASFVAVFTQERALRLMQRKDTIYDALIIDEAHNILKSGNRGLLLSRLIARNLKKNKNLKIVYLSPLIENVKNLKVSKDQIISPYKINFNIKEPEIFELRLDNNIYKYNRFVNEFYQLGTTNSIFSYVNENSRSKNFLYNRRPIKIELLAKQLSENLPELTESKPILELHKLLVKEVHKDFYGAKYLKYGIIYLHGKLPDLIKEYLEYKYKTLSELKYVIANTVILEGINMPIDCLFIFNTRTLHGKELMNLIGRVNRLNDVFSNQEVNLRKLLPEVHFINNTLHNNEESTMKNQIEYLRSRQFDDIIENPTLEEFDPKKIKMKKDRRKEYEERMKKIKEREDFLNSNPKSEKEKLNKYLIETGINEYYTHFENVLEIIYNRINNLKVNEWNGLVLMDKIESIFIRDIDDTIADYELRRLRRDKARAYYENYILNNQKKSLNENIVLEFNYLKRKGQSENPLLYFGESYGETPWRIDGVPTQGKKVYIDFSIKREDHQLINLAIVKLKMEDDFIGFTLNKFIVFLHDFKLISDDEYNQYVYGTKDTTRIDLTKYGLSLSLINRLEKDDQIKNLSFDSFNNLTGNSDFRTFLGTIDDFYRFEINRYFN